MKSQRVHVLRLRLVFGIAFALFFVPTVTSATTTFSVVGELEGIGPDGTAFGWAEDTDTPSLPILVHMYIDGLAGMGGQLIAVIPASTPRGDPPASGHGFRFSIPSRYRDGQLHWLYVYGIDSSGSASQNLLLSSAPKAFNLMSTAVHLDNGVIRVGLEPRCGGTLVEVRYRGAENLINNFDCGRQVQVALYDGNVTYDSCAGCTGLWGWDPVQGGDMYNFGSPIRDMAVTSNSIYVAVQPHEWNPDDKGGGPGQPVLSDVMIEQTASFVFGYPNAVRLHYRITHLGSDRHGYALQEFPAVYVNRGYDHFVAYGGPTPWANDAVTWDALTAPSQTVPLRYASERWSALVNDKGLGLMVYVPGQYPYAAGVQWSGTSGEYGAAANYFRPHVPFAFEPGSALEGDIYIIAGPYAEARQTVYALHASEPAPDVLPPFGFLDAPVSDQEVSGFVTVSGWVFDNTRLQRVDVLVDSSLAGTAIYGLSRPDVSLSFPNSPEQIGFAYALDTGKYANGRHRLTVLATDTSGNVFDLFDSTISISNVDSVAPAVRIAGISQIRRNLTVTVDATDEFGVTQVELFIDGRIVATDSSLPYSFSVGLRTVGLGEHRIVAKAYDAAGNVGVSAPVEWVRD